MLHPVINQIGVDTQRDVIKEEKRLRIDNVPYGQLLKAVKENIFKNHPYRWTTIGEMEHLDAATLDEFKAFFKKFYVPNNAVLVVAGDFDKAQTKKWIEDYFATIPEGQAVNKAKYQEEPITKQINATFEDKNVQLPMLVNAFRIPSFKDRDAYVLDFISSILSKGKSSRLYNRLVDQEKSTLEVGSFAYTQEDYGTYFIYALPMPGKTVQDLQASIDEELKKISSGLITDDEYQKTLNSIETDFVNQNSTSEGIAENLATNYLLRGNTNLINTEIDIYRSITREEIQNVAQKYLQPNQRLVLEYTGEKK
jgi:predicted Zn-dependent peptidase